MGYSPKIEKKHRDRILAQEGHKAQVKESFKVGKEVVTEPISELIRKDYEALNRAIDSLDKKDKDFPKKKQALIELKARIPKEYAINKATLFKIQDELNRILGVNTSATSNT